MPRSKAKMRIGLFGGSFNPAHEGHVMVSMNAIKMLRLDKVVWLFTPQNPLKQLKDYKSLDERMSVARRLIGVNNKIVLSDFEKSMRPPYYTYNTIRRIKAMYPNAEIVWIMGVDGLLHMHKWHMWHKINDMCHIVAFDRKIDEVVTLHKVVKSPALSRDSWSIIRPGTLNDPISSYQSHNITLICTKRLAISSSIINKASQE